MQQKPKPTRKPRMTAQERRYAELGAQSLAKFEAFFETEAGQRLAGKLRKAGARI